MRALFFGTSAFAVPSLERVVEAGHTILGCVTQPDRPQGRGLQPQPSPVKQAAQRLGLPLFQPEKPSADEYGALRPEIGIVIAYGHIIQPSLLALPPQGMLGVHPSLLPKYRGAAPVAWAILNGETTTGVTIFRLVHALDAGDILRQRSVPIQPQETCEALTNRLAILGAEELVLAIRDLEQGQAKLQPQDDAHATYAAKFTKAQGHIDWSQSAEQIVRMIRATHPWPGATTTWKGQGIKLLLAAESQDSLMKTSQTPGTIVAASAEGIHVSSGQGVVTIMQLQPAGRRSMSAKEFLAGHGLKPGDQFGD